MAANESRWSEKPRTTTEFAYYTIKQIHTKFQVFGNFSPYVFYILFGIIKRIRQECTPQGCHMCISVKGRETRYMHPYIDKGLALVSR